MKNKNLKKVIDSKLKSKFLYFPYAVGYNLEFKIHESSIETAKTLNGFSIVQCLEEYEHLIQIKVKDEVLLVNKSEILRILPNPKFKEGQLVYSKEYNKSFTIERYSWHHKFEKYYYLLIGKTKRFFEEELES